MTDRERLTNIIHNAQNKYLNLLKFESSILADYLLANGVIVPVRCMNCKYRTNKGICEKFRQRYPFFPDLNYAPELKDMIKLWLESEVKDPVKETTNTTM